MLATLSWNYNNRQGSDTQHSALSTQHSRLSTPFDKDEKIDDAVVMDRVVAVPPNAFGCRNPCFAPDYTEDTLMLDA